MPRDRCNSPPLPLDGSAPGDVANQDPLVEAAGSPSFGHPLSRSARLAPPLPMTPKRSPSNSRRGRSSWSWGAHNRASAQRLSRARRRVLARQNGSPMMVSTNSCSRGACMCVVTRAVMTARFNDCSTLVGGDDRPAAAACGRGVCRESKGCVGGAECCRGIHDARIHGQPYCLATTGLCANHNISLRDIGSTFGRFWSAGIVMCIVRIP